jgi:hypothetical protein
MRDADFIGAPCACPECSQAGVSDQPIRRDPRSGRWLHGYDLKRWLQAQQDFMRAARAAVGPKGRHAQGFEPLVREPGQEG